MRELSAAGMTLEPQCAAHADEMFGVLNDNAVYAFLDSAPPQSAALLREYFSRLESRVSSDGRELWLNWAIRLHTGEVAGFVQATVCEGGLAWIAFVIGRDFWGQGIAHRAARAMLDELTASEGVTLCLASADGRNQRSIALLARLGFVLASPALRSEHGLAPTDVLMSLRTTPALQRAD